jgi:hypothetical protein
MAAKSNKSKSSTQLPMPVDNYVMPTDMHVNLKKFRSVDDHEVGDKCSGYFEGKVTAINKNDQSETMTIEITKLEKGDY